MKTYLSTFFLFISLTGLSQKFALLDAEFKKPILYTDSVTLDQISSKLIPIQANSFDTISTHLKYVRDLLSNKIQRAKMKSFELRSGLTIIKVTSVQHAYGDSYDIDVTTKANNISSNFRLAKNEDLNKGNIKKIDRLLNYMKNASSLFNNGYVEMQPKLYEVIVYQ
jgi:hypothetical protein